MRQASARMGTAAIGRRVAWDVLRVPAALARAEASADEKVLRVPCPRLCGSKVFRPDAGLPNLSQ
jgi:hypothetical protein